MGLWERELLFSHRQIGSLSFGSHRPQSGPDDEMRLCIINIKRSLPPSSLHADGGFVCHMPDSISQFTTGLLGCYLSGSEDMIITQFKHE